MKKYIVGIVTVLTTVGLFTGIRIAQSQDKPISKHIHSFEKSSIKPFRPILPSSTKGERRSELKISPTLYETIVDGNGDSIPGTPAYIQFDHFNIKSDQWQTIWAGHAYRSNNEPMLPYGYDFGSVISENNGSKIVDSVFDSSGDSTGFTANLFYVNPSESEVVSFGVFGGLSPNVVGIDRVRAAILKTKGSISAIAFTGNNPGDSADLISYNAAKNTLKYYTITNPVTLLALEADGKPYVMVTVHGNGSFSFQSENGAHYRTNSSKTSLVIAPGEAVGFNLGSDMGLYTNAGYPSEPVYTDNASLLRDILLPYWANGVQSFDVGITQGEQINVQWKIHISYSRSVNKGNQGVVTGLPFKQQNPKNTSLFDTSMSGYTIYSNTCSGCHGMNLEGSVGPALLGIGNFANESKLINFITAGKGIMPPGGGLTSPAQIQQVADWLMKQTQKQKNTPLRIKTQQDAVKLVKEVFKNDLKKDSNLMVQYDHSQKINGQTVFVIHVYENMPTHTATVDWVGVRSDGMLQSQVLFTPWTTPKNYLNVLQMLLLGIIEPGNPPTN